MTHNDNRFILRELKANIAWMTFKIHSGTHWDDALVTSVNEIILRKTKWDDMKFLREWKRDKKQFQGMVQNTEY